MGKEDTELGMSGEVGERVGMVRERRKFEEKSWEEGWRERERVGKKERESLDGMGRMGE